MELGARSRVGRLLVAVVAATLISAFLALAPGGGAVAGAGEVRKAGTLGEGYAFVATDGGIFNYGDSEFFGSTGAIPLNKPIVGMAATPSGEGYWLVAADGGIFTFGDAEFFGSTGNLKLVRPIVGMSVHPTGRGYWLVAADGGIFTFGSPNVIKFHGSQGGKPLNQPIVGMVATFTGNGYYLVATDGGIFTFGDARFRGSRGGAPLNKPIVGIDLTPTGEGYYLVASDGGIFTYGDALFFGSRGGAPLNKPIVGMATTPFSPVTAPDFVVNLEGEQEVGSAGDPDGTGVAFLDFTDDEACWYIQADAVTTPTAAHIHEAPAGVNGPVVFDFGAPNSEGDFEGCKAIEKALVDSILADPQRFYVNIHNAAFPAGALRGQVADELVLIATPGNEVFAFYSSTPEEFVLGPLKVTGLGVGEEMVGHDVRPKTGEIYAITRVPGDTVGRIYKIATNGTATRVGTEADNVTISGQGVGFDFNPVADRIRVVTPDDQNYRINPDTGAVIVDGTINPSTASLSGAAYTNSGRSSTAPASTTFYALDHDADTIVTVNPPNAGTVTNPKPLGIDLGFSNGFDVGPAPEGKAGTTLFTSVNTGGTTDVYVVDPATGATTKLGNVAKIVVSSSIV